MEAKRLLLTFLIFGYTSITYASWNSCEYSLQGDLFANTKCDITCEGYPLLFSCPGNDVIKIISAEYGRTSATECETYSGETKNTNCILSEAKEILSGRCNNKTVCSFTLSNDVFPDPCPGTKKYLETKYQCVKFILGCPGELMGIGDEVISRIAVQPNPGSWTKDPLLGNEHVFFAPSPDVVHEYSSWEDFIEGSYTRRYNLPNSMASGNIVVYDKNLYYVKADSPNIIRYSLITERRTKEGVMPVPKSQALSLDSISLAIDENGLWITFSGEGGKISIGKLDKELLIVRKTWATVLTQEDSLYTFFICGTMYSVNPKTGKIDYSFDTNKPPGKEAQTRSISFDEDKLLEFIPREQKWRKRSFLRHNTSSISYNPRERLLYLWDERKANAIYYKLHFETEAVQEDGSAKVTKPGTTTSSRTRTSKFTSSTETRGNSPTKDSPSRSSSASRNWCTSAIRNHITWPRTNAGEIARIECIDGGGGFATWRCGEPSSSGGPRWDQEGPDFFSCIGWLSDIIWKYDSGDIDRGFAFESLKSALAIRADQISGKWIKIVSKLIANLLEDATPPTKNDGKGIVESASTIVSTLLEAKESWAEIDEVEVSTIAWSLLESFKKAAFLYSDAVSRLHGVYDDREILRIRSSKILAQIEVRDRSLRYLMRKSKTTFPDEEFCKEAIDQCETNVVMVPDDVIMREIIPGSSPTVLFAVFDGLETFLSPTDDDGWEVDSSIMTLSLRNQILRARRSNPLAITLKHKSISSLPRRCMHWDQNDEEGAGNWTTSHCRLASSNRTHTECLCDAPATFAVFVDKSKMTPASRHEAVEVVIGVGIGITFVCLLICFVTFAAFKNLQNDRNSITKNLCLCLMISEAVFLLGISQMKNEIFCSIVSGMLHFFLLASFMWMALGGIQIYIMLTELFEEESRRKWYYMSGYGIPAGIVGVSASIGYAYYGTERGCFVDPYSNVIWSVVVPVIIIVFINLCPLFGAMYKIHKSTLAFADSEKITLARTYLKGAFILLSLELLNWTLAILWINERTSILAYLFVTFNIMQGVFVILFYCFAPLQIRQEYSRVFKRLPCCRKKSKESYVTDSMTFSKHYSPGRFENASASSPTRHLSLASQARHPWNTAITLPKTVDASPMLEYPANSPGNRENPRLEEWPQRGHGTSFTIRPSCDHDRYREQQPFLQPTYEMSQPQGLPTNTAQSEIAYNRLQHHRHHSAYYPHGPEFEMEHILPPARYRTGIPQSSKRHNGAKTLAESCAIRTNPHFGPSSRSHVPAANVIFHHRQLSTPENGPLYWELDPPFLRSHTQYRQRLHDPIVDANPLPPNSIIQRLKNEMSSQEVHPGIAGRPVPEYSGNSVSHGLSPPSEMLEFPSKTHAKNVLSNQKRTSRNSSEDEGQGSSFEDQENSNICSQSDIAATRCARHDDTSIISPSQTHSKLSVNDNLIRISINSDSDDPIATDCSGSSYGSSYGRQSNRWSNQEMLV